MIVIIINVGRREEMAIILSKVMSGTIAAFRNSGLGCNALISGSFLAKSKMARTNFFLGLIGLDADFSVTFMVVLL